MTQTLDLAVQHRLKPLEHAFDAPALAIQARNGYDGFLSNTLKGVSV
jgi:predicted kinase